MLFNEDVNRTKCPNCENRLKRKVQRVEDGYLQVFICKECGYEDVEELEAVEI